MASVLWVLFAIVLGCLLIYRFGNLSVLRPRWAAGLLIFAGGTMAGIGLTSCLFLLLHLLAPGLPSLPMWVEAVLLGWVTYSVFLNSSLKAIRTTRAQSSVDPALIGTLLLAMIIVTCGIIMAWGTNPHGYLDAWFIWNLRARFLTAGGGLALGAWSPLLTFTHPEYPLLTSSFIARSWVYGSSTTTLVPMVTAYVFFLAMLSTAIASITILRASAVLGLLFALLLIGTPSLMHEVPTQGADFPVACYFLTAVTLLLLDRPALAGLMAGFAAWTKDEGVLFFVVLVVVTAGFRRHQLRRMMNGGLPVTALVIAFKLMKGTAYVSGRAAPDMVDRIMDLGRYEMVLAALGREFVGMMRWLYHPLIPALLLGIVLGLERQRRRDFGYCGTICVSLLLGYCAIYVITPYDLAWQLRTSLNRLVMQFWPTLLLTLFVGLREPETMLKVPLAQPEAKVRAS
jgi:hypothetical protein